MEENLPERKDKIIMKKYLKFLIPITIGIIILYFLFARKSSVEKEIDGIVSGDRCITPPAHFKQYDDASIEWGDYAGGIRDYIGDYDENVKLVSSFLKGLDIQPSRAYVKYYQDEIKAYLNSKKSLPSWETQVGQFSCDSGGMFPEDVQLP